MTGLRRMAWLLLALPVVAALLWAGPASAAARTIVIQDGPNGPQLVPSSLTVAPGDIVSFLNNSAYPAGYDVTVTYGAKVEYSEPIGFGSAGARHWTAPAGGGVRKVTATQPVTGIAARGTITVTSPPPAPTSAPPPTSPPATASAKPTAPPTKVASATPPPTAPPSAAASAIPVPSIGPLPSTSAQAPAPGSSPLVAGTPSPKPTATHVVSGGPLEQPTGRAHGLPAALAAVFVGGTAAAYVRVLLAEPVDDGPGTVGDGR